MKFLLNLIIIITIPIFAQQPILSHQIGSFVNAEAFSISQSGFIYVTDSETNEIYKLDFNGAVLKYIGGYGWSQSSFDNPVDIFATTLNVYVTDENNDRVQFFDKDLNFISVFSSQNIANPEYDFRYPTSAVVSPLGDLFILDSDNSRILKFDLNGNFSVEIGSYDAGSFALRNPTKFDISSDSKLFVLDGNEIKLFDQFGGGLHKFEIDSGAVNLQVESDVLCIAYPHKVKLFNLLNNERNMVDYLLDKSERVKDALVYKKQLYVLTANTILVYNLPML